jgi:hypothetical protein
MKIFHTITILVAGFFVLSNSLHAQLRTCRVVSPERPNNAPKIAYLFDGVTSQRIALPSMNFSKVIELPAGELTLILSPKEIIDPKILPPNASRLKLPEGVTDFYILISPDPKNKEFPIKMNLVDASGGKLKSGETLWYNLTEHRIMARLGNAKMSVKPKEQTISKDPIPASGHYKAMFTYQVKGKGAPARITEQYWWHDAGSRHLGFILNSGGRLPKIYFYRDFRVKKLE